MEIIHGENVPEKGGVIVATNHVSYLDPLVVGCAVKKRRATFMARQGLFKIPLLKIFVRSFSFPVHRKNPKPSTIKEAVKRLKNGELIVMFPEGERSKDGNFLEAKRGIGTVAAMARPAIVPAFIHGTHRALPAGAKFIRPSKIKVVFGSPMVIDKTGKDFQDKIGDDIMEGIRKLKAMAEDKSS